jgi:hypothetical protein
MPANAAMGATVPMRERPLIRVMRVIVDHAEERSSGRCRTLANPKRFLSWESLTT